LRERQRRLWRVVIPVGLAIEIAEMLGVSRPSVWRYVRRDDFPAPDAEVSGKRLWKRSAVERWAKKPLPLKFDPRSKGDT
jgi:predicted DNA-binding transcriptional regulator AlpA